MKISKKVLVSLITGGALLILPQSTNAATTCDFTTNANVMTLNGDCTTDSTILIPDGMTLDGNDHTITAVDPSGNHFRGGVIKNVGTTASVKNLTVNTDSLANACDGGDDRLRGILFQGASGSIMHNTVMNINQGSSGCQEGNAIEVRNEPFDNTHPNTLSVEIAHNSVVDYQKTGIVVNGDINASVHHNAVGASATQANLAANSIQFGYGATGSITQNNIAGNQWLGQSNWAATAILLYLSEDVSVLKNIINGNSEIGIYNSGSGSIIDNNKVFDEGADAATHGYDYGIGNWGTDALITNNKVRGFDNPYDGVTGGKNKSIPGAQPNNEWY